MESTFAQLELNDKSASPSVCQELETPTKPRLGKRPVVPSPAMASPFLQTSVATTDSDKENKCNTILSTLQQVKRHNHLKSPLSLQREQIDCTTEGTEEVVVQNVTQNVMQNVIQNMIQSQEEKEIEDKQEIKEKEIASTDQNLVETKPLDQSHHTTHNSTKTAIVSLICKD